jgi:hypothetical protein
MTAATHSDIRNGGGEKTEHYIIVTQDVTRRPNRGIFLKLERIDGSNNQHHHHHCDPISSQKIIACLFLVLVFTVLVVSQLHSFISHHPF